MHALTQSRMSRRELLALGAGLSISWTSLADAQDSPSFHDVVERHFVRWTRGLPGVLTSLRVNDLTDAQLALGSNAGPQGIWLNLLEIAAGIVEEQNRKTNRELPLDTLGGGGDSVFSIQLLTGHKAIKHVIRPKVNGNHPAPAAHEVPQLAERFSQLIHEGIVHRRLVCCGIGDWAVPPGLIRKHQYAILGVKQGHIAIWNPWGNTYHFKPKGNQGLEHGYITDAGHFSMSAHDFVRVFGAVSRKHRKRTADSVNSNSGHEFIQQKSWVSLTTLVAGVLLPFNRESVA